MVFGDVNFTSILHHLLEMLLESHLRLTMSVLCCFSLDVLRLTWAAPTIERSITIEQCHGHRLKIPQIFLHTSDSHLCLNCFSNQPNDPEVYTATAKRLYTCCITYYYTFTSIRQGYFGSTEKHNNREFSNGTLLFNYSCILLKGMKQNIHLDLLFKILCMKIRPSALVAE